MRIYSTELLAAAAAFIASLSSCSASGSEIAQPELFISNPSHDRQDGVTEDQALQTKDEAEKEARMEPPREMSALIGSLKGGSHDIPGSTVATAVRTRLAQLGGQFAEALMEHPVSSKIAAKPIRQDPKGRRDVPPQATDEGALNEADVTEIIAQEKENPTKLSAERRKGMRELVEKINAGSWTLQMLQNWLSKCNDASDDELTKLASALRTAKANNPSKKELVSESETMMLSFWGEAEKEPKEAFDYLELGKLLVREGLTDENLRLLQRYIDMHHNRQGRIPSVPRLIMKKLGWKKLLPMIGPAWEKYEGVIELLNRFVRRWLHDSVTAQSIMKKLHKAQMSDPMTLRLLLTLADQTISQLRQQEFNSVVEALKNGLVTQWMADGRTSVDDVYTMLKLSDQSNLRYFDVRMDVSERFVAALRSKYENGPDALSSERLSTALAYHKQAHAGFEERPQKRQRVEGHQVTLMEHPVSSKIAAKPIRQDPKGRRDVPPQATDEGALNEADVTEIIAQEKENPTKSSAERRKGMRELVEKINAGSWTLQMLQNWLSKCNDASDDELTKLASALRTAKANNPSKKELVSESETMMLSFWGEAEKKPKEAFDYLELGKLLVREGLTDENLRLLQRYIDFMRHNRRGRIPSVPRLIMKKLGWKKLLPMIGPAWEKYEGVIELLNRFVRRWLHDSVTAQSIMEKLHKAQMSDPMTLRLLLTLADQTISQLRQQEFNSVVEALKNGLVTQWMADGRTSVDDVYTMLKLSDQSNLRYFDVRMDVSERFVAALRSKYENGPDALSFERLSTALAYHKQAHAGFEERPQKRQRVEGHQVKENDWSWLDRDEGFGDVTMVLDKIR